MIIRKTPKDKEKYIIVTNNELAFKLQLNGFMPKYIDDEAMYFIKSEEILSIINGE